MFNSCTGCYLTFFSVEGEGPVTGGDKNFCIKLLIKLFGAAAYVLKPLNCAIAGYLGGYNNDV